MQPTSQIPAPPPPPDLVPVVPVSPLTGEAEGARAVFTIPKTAEQVRGLRARQQEIREQLDAARDQRNEIAEHLQNGAPQGRDGIERQLQAVDERILLLERDLTTTGRLVTSASPELLAQTIEPSRDVEARQAESDAEEQTFAGFAGGVMLTLLASALWRRFRRRRVDGRRVGAAASAEDPRIDRLTQAVEAIALEVERIGEGQRFVTQLMATERERATIGGQR